MLTGCPGTPAHLLVTLTPRVQGEGPDACDCSGPGSQGRWPPSSAIQRTFPYPCAGGDFKRL